MKQIILTLSMAALAAHMPALARPVNYDESKVAPYTLEDPLTFADGTKLRSPDEWPRRRAEILDIFAREMYGVEPPKPEAVVTEIVESGETLAGLGIREQVRMWFKADTWGLSRAVDYAERSDALDAKRVIVTGCSTSRTAVDFRRPDLI